ncbi:MAG: AAA family ATPase [Gammaproteobacteria bacterium]|nr:AAA family ATPase [Gammaproteobacteria bacterium]MYD01874.1 AAA family ATPase [Gammaproteobacteria bacterium]MYI26083.1 AAA family ATPase [Gammaproteobacteria bacterium]
MGVKTTSGNSAKGTGPWVLRGKLRPPLGHHSLLERSDLVASLDDLLNYQASIVIAPAGYGKTTLLTQWRERLSADGCRAGWLTLDGQDADTYRFLCYSIFALAEAGVDLGQLEMFAEQGLTELPLESALVRFLSSVEAAGKPVVLILDDYHRLESESIDQLLDKLIDNAPGNLHLIISSRHRPAFNVAQLCLTGRGIEIGAEMLRFSDAEMQQALGNIRNEEVLGTIQSTTEGWPVAVQLARLAYVGGGSFDMRAMTGSEGHIAHFFSEQVVRGLEEKHQQLLTRTAILDQFNVELANAVYGGADASKILHSLSDLSALIVRLDEEGEWYRYHHLFAEFLTGLLGEREADHVEELHARASLWFEHDGDTQHAVRHAVLAGDMPRAAHLIESAGGWELILFGGIGYLRNLLNLIPEDQVTLFPRLEIAKSYLLLKMGNVASARGHFDRACAQREQTDGDPEWGKWFARDALNIGSLLSAYEDDETALNDAIGQKQVALPNGEPDRVTDGVLACQRVVTHIYCGRFRTAETTLRAAMRYMRQANSVLGLNYCYVHAAVNNFHVGRINQALADARESSSMASDNFGSDSGLKSLSDVALGALLFWRNELTEDDWRRFELALEHTARYDGWFEIYAMGLETTVDRALLHGDIEAANGIIERTRRLARERSMERLDRHADSMALHVAVEKGDRLAAGPIARKLRDRHPPGLWREKRFWWRNHVHAMLALANHCGEKDRADGEAYLQDAEECCRKLGAGFLLLRVRVTCAAQLHRLDLRREALEQLARAIRMARPEGLTGAVARPGPMLALLRHAQSYWRRKPGETATRRFVGEAINLIQQSAEKRPDASNRVSLSPREMEVLWELSLGRSNKQIARALYMTEHTVKFHLKNVFRKLSVNRRTEAMRVAREHNLI